MKIFLLSLWLLAACSKQEEAPVLIDDAHIPEVAEGELTALEIMEPKLDGLSATLQAHLRAQDFNGVALVAAHGEIIFNEGFGLAQTEGQVPMTPNQKFQIASLSKSFVAVSILQLVEQGALTLETTLNEFLPDIYRSDEMTIHHLLTHSSGLFSGDDLTHYSDFTEPKTLIQYAYDPRFQHFEVIGEGTIYSNLGYDILGVIVEMASGLPYEVYLKRYILDVVGMPDTGLNVKGEPFYYMATAYSGHISEGEQAPVFHPSFGFSSGGLHSTTYDLFNYSQALLQGTLLTSESWELMIYPHTQVGRGLHGYGFFRDVRGVANSISHTGNLLGWHGVLIQELDNAATVIMLTNHSAGSDMQIGFDLARFLMDLMPKFD